MQRFFVLLFLFGFAVSAEAKGFKDLPVLKARQCIYTLPSDFEPKALSAGGRKKLEDQCKSLKYPFYLIFVQEVPGGTQADLQVLLEKIYSKWGADASGAFDSHEHHLMLFAYQPENYRFIAGSQFTPYKPYQFLNSFEQNLQKSKDSAAPFLGLMRSLDQYLIKSVAAKDKNKNRTNDDLKILATIILFFIILFLMGDAKASIPKRQRRSFSGHREWRDEDRHLPVSQSSSSSPYDYDYDIPVYESPKTSSWESSDSSSGNDWADDSSSSGGDWE